MLGAANRLRDRADFNTVRERGRRWRGDLLILNAMQHKPNGEPDGASRFGFVVSRRVGKAVVRNRVKRRLRAIIRRHLNAIARGYDIVLIARPGAGEASFTALAGAALALLRQARLVTDLPEVS
jgi:ribonuclease P protein component